MRISDRLHSTRRCISFDDELELYPGIIKFVKNLKPGQSFKISQLMKEMPGFSRDVITNAVRDLRGLVEYTQEKAGCNYIYKRKPAAVDAEPT